MMSGPSDVEEPNDQIMVDMQLAPFKHGFTKVTLFFTTYEPEHVLQQLISLLKKREITFEKEGLKKGKLTFTKVRE